MEAMKKESPFHFKPTFVNDIFTLKSSTLFFSLKPTFDH